jgi:hypothetical protein
MIIHSLAPQGVDSAAVWWAAGVGGVGIVLAGLAWAIIARLVSGEREPAPRKHRASPERVVTGSWRMPGGAQHHRARGGRREPTRRLHPGYEAGARARVPEFEPGRAAIPLPVYTGPSLRDSLPPYRRDPFPNGEE